jgi:hypothetical protein
MFRERKQTSVRGWRTKEGIEVSEQIGCQLESTGNMIDRLSDIITHDERIAR